MSVRGKVVLGTALAVLALGASVACTMLTGLTGLNKSGPGIPTVRVVREPVEVKVYTIGELRPARSAMIVAPPVSGGTLQIIHIVKTGTRVNQGDIVVEFDPSEQEYNLEQSQSQLDEAEQQIKKMRADQAVRVAQESVSLLSAQFNVSRAELVVKGNDLLGAIEAKKNLINLDEARRRLEQLRRDIKSHASSDQADLAVQNVARTKAMLGMKLAQQNIDNMTVKAPIGGIVVLGQNLESLMSAGGGISIYSGMEIPEYREGDQAYAGRLVAQIQDVEQMEIQSKVTENDRGSLDSGQPIDVWVDSQPQKNFTGKIKSLSVSASSSTSSSYLDYLEALSTRSFDATFALDPNGEQLNPGVTTRVTVRATSVNNALSLPRQALFQKEGKPVVYLRRADGGWEAREVQIKYLTESRAVIEGLPEGTEVALVNPDLQKGKAAGKAGPLASIIGGSTQ